MNDWHADDLFWASIAPFLFHEERWAGTSEEIDAITDLVAATPDDRVLDLGCGPGRHTLELARRGFEVTGVDRTAAFLERARAAADEEGLDVELVQADMREFLRPDSFDLAINLYTTFGYFSDAADNQRVLDNIFQSLRDEGLLLLEMNSKEILAREFRARDWRERDGVYLLEERRIVDDWRRVENRWIVVTDEDRKTFELGHWIYSAVGLERMLHEAGFAAVDFYGDLDGRPYDQEARRMVAVAWK